uniref:Uncharacterized protein n=1 Tax=Anguilla anguilla TaxID=7936 RepID=A0A0E9PLE9_ANGAN
MEKITGITERWKQKRTRILISLNAIYKIYFSHNRLTF